MKWVGFRVRMLYQTMRSLKRTTICMMLRPIKESVRNLVLTQVLISASHAEKTMDSVLCTFGFHIVGLRLPITTIQTLTLLCSMMSELPTEKIQP